ncbi:LPXTG cell wall anchor domain-containing protein [Enterococcus sp. RIT-PI-f]|uniref:LPXTG cell wall anchor domain-containing protein n=1 Tax=Enterococcus sp. RIT-PI-f TaxID=1690244 RepID=UPI0006CCB746|nr:LPXTG cell wall anchor domain-containing protein [Enterococcus sp. RIT-PI-f]KPG68525.1 hypothetical protein AEQ18_14780 [Enterococcus sp. RIT-PI-f]
MKKKRKRLGAFVLLIAILSCFTAFSLDGMAKEVQQVETQGTIRFTGVWKDPSEIPDPAPPSNNPIKDVAKAEERLPQTDEIAYHWLAGVGGCLIGTALFLWAKQKRTT